MLQSGSGNGRKVINRAGVLQGTISAHTESSASKLFFSLAGFTDILLLLYWKPFWQFKLFFHTVIALFNFKLLIFFPPTVFSAMLMWLMMLGIRTSSESFSLCDVKTIYIVIPNKFSIWQSPLLALDDFFFLYHIVLL